jgi:hypothetical protein
MMEEEKQGPNLKWLDCIKNDLKLMSVKRWRKKAEDIRMGYHSEGSTVMPTKKKMLEVQYHCRTDNVRSKNLKEVIANLKQGL